MSRKALAFWATVMIVVFGVTVIVYPLIFNPQNLDRNISVPGQELPVPGGPVSPGSPPVPPPVK